MRSGIGGVLCGRIAVGEGFLVTEERRERIPWLPSWSVALVLFAASVCQGCPAPHSSLHKP